MTDGIDKLVTIIAPDHDLDTLNQIADKGATTLDQFAPTYDMVKAFKHIARGAIYGAVLAELYGASLKNVALISAGFAVLDIVQYAKRSIDELTRRGVTVD